MGRSIKNIGVGEDKDERGPIKVKVEEGSVQMKGAVGSGVREEPRPNPD
jgi:hypothetical protein